MMGSLDDRPIDPGGSGGGPPYLCRRGRRRGFKELLAGVSVEKRTVGNDGISCVANVLKHCKKESVVALVLPGVGFVPARFEVVQLALPVIVGIPRNRAMSTAVPHIASHAGEA